MTALLGAVVLASVVGSLHCVGMCGGLVAFCVGGDPSRGVRRGLVHAVYSFGRLVAYVALGSAAGSIGAALDLAGRLAGAQRIAGIVAGIVMVGWGLTALAAQRGLQLPRHRSGGTLGRWLGHAVAAVGRRPPVVRSLVVGLLTGLLPCGWLWAFDPPYSPRQLKECYNGKGNYDTKASTWSTWKKMFADKIKPGGIVISFGWNSGGLGKTNGFEIIEILLVAHGGMHNDTICVVEQKSSFIQKTIL